jgi:hypothetical protein
MKRTGLAPPAASVVPYTSAGMMSDTGARPKGASMMMMADMKPAANACPHGDAGAPAIPTHGSAPPQAVPQSKSTLIPARASPPFIIPAVGIAPANKRSVFNRHLRLHVASDHSFAYCGLCQVGEGNCGAGQDSERENEFPEHLHIPFNWVENPLFDTSLSNRRRPK